MGEGFFKEMNGSHGDWSTERARENFKVRWFRRAMLKIPVFIPGIKHAYCKEF